MRLIDADELFEKGVILIPAKYYEGARIVIDAIRNAPTVEAEPIKHGRWIDTTETVGWTKWNCSVCGGGGRGDYKFCPWCGSRMDEVKE